MDFLSQMEDKDIAGFTQNKIESICRVLKKDTNGAGSIMVVKLEDLYSNNSWL